MYRVKIKSGCTHSNHESGNVINAGESEFNAFNDKFILLGNAKNDAVEMPKNVKKVVEHYGANSPEVLNDLSDEQIMDVPRIGPAKLEDIREWQQS